MAEVTKSRAGGLRRGELSSRTRTHIETIRYYERIGLMPDPPRTPGGHRVYGHDHVKRMSFIGRARELGFTIADIRELFALVDSGDITCSEVKSLALRHAADLRGKIDDLVRLEARLSPWLDDPAFVQARKG